MWLWRPDCSKDCVWQVNLGMVLIAAMVVLDVWLQAKDH